MVVKFEYFRLIQASFKVIKGFAGSRLMARKNVPRLARNGYASESFENKNMYVETWPFGSLFYLLRVFLNSDEFATKDSNKK